ncbi:uncharacterized protein LOC121407449 isoform X3 [Lytechinus variegatus]|uniref:uncharacterized protein LOC121407449 isoform X3 n=1 Tax=Lytechinus variegatus TaxID=7654 RepID=UPI001BB1A66C|nr:uncharacterized protein LOC121407449 isoform X3 [Lytechinus variegatus]
MYVLTKCRNRLFKTFQTEDMGNQNGTAPSGGAAPEVSNANSGTTSNTTSSSSGSSSSNNGRTNQRRATSPGMPNRAGRKGARSVQSTAGGTPAPPTPTKPTHMKSSNQPQNQHPHQQQQQAANAQNQAKGNEFVDFIYDYATKENGEGGESNGKNGEDSTNKKNKSFDAVVAGDLAGHREHVDKKQGRGERARAHTHGHAARKHKSPANKPNTKSTLVVDYIDASQNPQSYSSSNLTVPEMNAGNDSGHQFGEFTRPKAATESKPHRERARAQSHGHRKKGSGDAKSQNKQKGTSSSSDTSDREHVVNLLAVPPKPAKPSENGHRSKLSSSTNELDDTSRDDNRSHENLSDVSVHDSSMSEKPYEAMPSDKNKRDTPPSSTGENFENGTSSSDLAKLKHENAKLRKELADSRKSSDKDSKKIENMEAEIKKLKLREAEDAKTLETMVQHVEANLKRTTERAVTAENTITKLKAEIKQLKSELGGGSSGKQKTEENKELKDIREKANAASLKLATAAKEAETNIKQLMSGVDVLKVLAETLACIDRISEDKSDKPKSFGTAL